MPYTAFKDAILAHYPDATGDYMYSLADIDQLIGERYRIGIRTLDDLTEYHNQFEAITSWLRTLVRRRKSATTSEPSSHTSGT